MNLSWVNEFFHAIERDSVHMIDASMMENTTIIRSRVITISDLNFVLSTFFEKNKTKKNTRTLLLLILFLNSSICDYFYFITVEL